MALLQAVVIGLIALIITPGFLFYFDITPKVVILLAGTAAVLFFAARGRGRETGPAAPRIARWFTVLLLLNFASVLISTALSADPARSLYGSTWRQFGAVAEGAAMLFAWLVAFQCAGRPDRVKTILRAVSLAGLMSAAYGIAQYFGWDPFIPKASYHIGAGVWTIVRPPGTLGYASYFATWLLLTVPLSLGLAAWEDHNAWRCLAAAAAALAVVAMLLTGTRAAIVGLAVGGAVWLYWQGFRATRGMGIAAVALLLASTGFYISPPGRQLRARMRWFAEDPRGGARPLLWRDSLNMAAHRLAGGYGPEVFLGLFPHFESKELAKAYPDFVHESPHNIFLDALVSQGTPGFLILGALCVTGFTAAWRLKSVQPAVAAYLAAALAAGVVSQQFTAFTAPTALLFFVTIALAVSLAGKAGPPRSQPLFAAAAPLAALVLLYFALRLTMAGHALARTKAAFQSGDLRAVSAEYENYWFWRLPGTSADVWYSRSWMDVARQTTNIGVLEEAVTIAEQAAARATETAEEPFAAWYNLAQINAVHNDAAATERSLRAAIAAHPNWFKPHWTLAQVLRVQVRLEEAEAEAALAVELDGGRDAEVSRTLQEIRAARADSHSP
jgi:O-antigen ligase